MVKGGKLEVHLLGATGIKNMDFFSKSDPYAELTCSGQHFKSNTAKGQGTTPVWNQKFEFVIGEGVGGVGGVGDLFIKLYDEDRFTADDFIGSVKVPLKRVLSELEHPLASYNVIRPSGRVRGEVKVALRFIPKEEDEESSSCYP